DGRIKLRIGRHLEGAAGADPERPRTGRESETDTWIRCVAEIAEIVIPDTGEQRPVGREFPLVLRHGAISLAAAGHALEETDIDILLQRAKAESDRMPAQRLEGVKAVDLLSVDYGFVENAGAQHLPLASIDIAR